MKNIIFALFSLFVISFSASATSQTHCPIRGGEVDKEVFSDYKEYRIYYCCPGCDKKFDKAPEKHIKTMQDKGIKLTKIQSKCPVSGEDVTQGDVIYKSSKGDVALCCKKCLRKMEKNPSKYLKKLEKKGVTIGAIAQAKKDTKKHDHGKHDHGSHKH